MFRFSFLFLKNLSERLYQDSQEWFLEKKRCMHDRLTDKPNTVTTSCISISALLRWDRKRSERRSFFLSACCVCVSCLSLNQRPASFCLNTFKFACLFSKGRKLEALGSQLVVISVRRTWLNKHEMKRLTLCPETFSCIPLDDVISRYSLPTVVTPLDPRKDQLLFCLFLHVTFNQIIITVCFYLLVRKYQLIVPSPSPTPMCSLMVRSAWHMWTIMSCYHSYKYDAMFNTLQMQFDWCYFYLNKHIKPLFTCR